MVYLYSEILCTNTNMKFKSKILTKRRLEYESNISTNIKFKNQENMSRDRNQSSSCPVMGGQCCELLGKLFHDRSVLGWGLQSIKEISGVENILHTDLVKDFEEKLFVLSFKFHCVHFPQFYHILKPQRKNTRRKCYGKGGIQYFTRIFSQ